MLMTPSFHARGQLHIVGNLLDFLNDPGRDALLLSQARVAPHRSGGPLRSMSLPQISVRKQETVLLYLVEQEARAQIRLLARREPMILHTPLAILRGALPLSAEARSEDFLALVQTPFVVVTDASLFLLTETATPFPQQADILLIGRQHIQMYYPAPPPTTDH